LILKSSYAASAKPIELKFSAFVPTTHLHWVNVYAPFGKELEERTNGRVKVVFFSGETLGKAKDHYDMAVRGIADMVTFIHGYTPGRFPLAGVMELPIRVPSGEIGSRVFWELYEKYMKQEYSDVKVVWLTVSDAGQIQTTKKPVKTLQDLKGLRLRSPGPIPSAILKACDGSALTIPIPDLYDSLQKGMADGAFMNFSATTDFKLGDVLKHFTVVNGYAMTAGIAMNLKTWNNLPPEVQRIIDELAGLRLSLRHGTFWDKGARMTVDAANKTGAQIYELSPADKRLWMEKVEPVNEAWIADVEKKGLPGRKIFQDAVSLLEKYSK
jgi:TRAP-type C4-dicarboxylate transport system substrate-binding protein